MTDPNDLVMSCMPQEKLFLNYGNITPPRKLTYTIIIIKNLSLLKQLASGQPALQIKVCMRTNQKLYGDQKCNHYTPNFNSVALKEVAKLEVFLISKLKVRGNV